MAYISTDSDDLERLDNTLHLLAMSNLTDLRAELLLKTQALDMIRIKACEMNWTSIEKLAKEALDGK